MSDNIDSFTIDNIFQDPSDGRMMFDNLMLDRTDSFSDLLNGQSYNDVENQFIDPNLLHKDPILDQINDGSTLWGYSFHEDLPWDSTSFTIPRQSVVLNSNPGIEAAVGGSLAHKTAGALLSEAANQNPKTSGTLRSDVEIISTGQSKDSASHQVIMRENIPTRRCRWPQCKCQGPLCDTDYVIHLEIHRDDLSSECNLPAKCQWPGCTSKRQFQSKAALKIHLNNIHVRPLRCHITECQQGQPFGTPGDLRRHISSIHGQGQDFVCQIGSCQAVFKREDKLIKHKRETHGKVRCELNHCGQIIPAGDDKRHIRRFHPGIYSESIVDYECALGACGRRSASRFSGWGLQEHCKKVHQMEWLGRLGVFEILWEANSRTLREIHLKDPTNIADCKACLEAEAEAQHMGQILSPIYPEITPLQS